MLALVAIDHQSDAVLAYTFGTREQHVLEELFLLSKPFNIDKVYADDNYAYEKDSGVDKVLVSERNM